MIIFGPKKRFALFILIAFLGGAREISARCLPQTVQSEQVLDWDKVLAAYGSYIDYPSQENARALLIALPLDRLFKKSGDTGQALNLLFSPDNFPVLYEEAISGDRKAIEIYFRLLNVADGYYTELLLSGLGSFMRNYPQLFLEILLKYKDINHIKNNGYPVSFIGAGHNVHSKAAIYILEKRIEALESVTDPRYSEIKESCIRKLRKAISEY